MTIKTGAERLRVMIAKEEENAIRYITGDGPRPFSETMAQTASAMRVFLEAAHAHQYPGVKATGKPNPCRCWICMCVEEMTRAFEEGKR